MEDPTPPDPAPSGPPTRWYRPSSPIARGFGAFLCLAGGLKLYQIDDTSPEGIEATFALVGASIELILGGAVLLGLWPAASERAAGLLYLLLAATALIGTTRGYPECGCLGDVPSPPWLLLVVDLAGTVALLWRPLIADRPPGKAFGFLDAAFLGAFFVGMAIGSIMFPRFIPVTSNLDESEIARTSSFAIEKPRFLERRFFLIPFIRIDADLTKGRWKVVLTRAGCRRCNRRLRSSLCRTEGDERLAIVLLHDQAGWKPPEGCQAVVGRLSPDKSWSFEAPMTFRLADGRVLPDD
ncbi:MAG: hypothetical protein ACYC61_30895 [Isosphaeraceae bacterium]